MAAFEAGWRSSVLIAGAAALRELLEVTIDRRVWRCSCRTHRGQVQACRSNRFNIFCMHGNVVRRKGDKVYAVHKIGALVKQSPRRKYSIIGGSPARDAGFPEAESGSSCSLGSLRETFSRAIAHPSTIKWPSLCCCGRYDRRKNTYSS